MWLWQQNRPDGLLLAYIVCGTTVAHLGALFFWFLVYGTVPTCSFMVTNRLLDGRKNVVFLPLHKRAPRGVTGGFKKAGVRASTNKKIEIKKTSVVKAKKQKQKKVTQKKMIQQKQVKSIESVTKSNAHEQSPSLVPIQHSDVHSEVVQSDDVIYVGQEEHDALVLHEQIQQEVVRCWHPPIGLDPALCCTVSVHVDWQGTSEKCAMIKASGILAYDISVHCAIKSIVFPRSTYGKDVILTFKQEQKL